MEKSAMLIVNGGHLGYKSSDAEAKPIVPILMDEGAYEDKYPKSTSPDNEVPPMIPVFMEDVKEQPISKKHNSNNEVPPVLPIFWD